jgi:hypothetical protein
MKYIHVLFILLVTGLLIVSCGAPAGGNVNLSPVAPTTLSTKPVDTATVAPTELPVEPFLAAPGMTRVKLLTDAEAVGRKPLFQWEAIPGADRYQLIVFDEAGDPYWAWEGTQTQIYMGGTQSQPPVDSSGPSIGSGYAWAIVAYSSDGKPLATSEVRKISP